MFEVVGAFCWDRHPFHASGVCSDFREICEIWNPQQQNIHTHTHACVYASPASRPYRSVITCLWALSLASGDCRQTSQGQRWQLRQPRLHLFLSFVSLPDESELKAKASPPPLHCPPPLPSPLLSSSVRGVEVIDVLRWERRCRAWIIISAGTEHRSQRTHQSRNRSWQDQMMKSSPSNDPHPRWGRLTEGVAGGWMGGWMDWGGVQRGMGAQKLSCHNILLGILFGYSVMEAYKYTGQWV